MNVGYDCIRDEGKYKKKYILHSANGTHDVLKSRRTSYAYLTVLNKVRILLLKINVRFTLFKTEKNKSFV